MSSNNRWMTVTDIAEYLALSVSWTRQAIITQPDFPVPFYPTGGKSYPRWLESEVHEWAVKKRNKAA